VEDIGGPGDVVVAKAKPSKATEKVAKLSSKAAKATVKGGAKSVAAKTNFKAVPMTIDDIEAPALDDGDLASTTVDSSLNEDFNDDFDHIDHSQKAALEKEKKAMDSMAAALSEEQNEQLNSLDDLNNEEAVQLAAAQNALRKKNSEAIASALASERAAALAAAREKALQDAKAKRAGLGGSGGGRGMADGRGAGTSGSPQANNQIAGAPQGVRSLDQLRQMPGNPRPQYDREERRRGDQGNIAFVAYISKDGYPTKFKMMKSTGYANLDSKTLEALKKWRFYPGQEGWVELPFRWDLRGGVQQDGGLLRRSVSRR
jgi:TonB family protein